MEIAGICTEAFVLRLEQNGRQVAGHIFRCIFMNEIFFISNKILLKCVPKGLIDIDSALIWIMVWHPIGAKLLPEVMFTNIITVMS